MSNMIKMSNVGAQTQKKWRPRGPLPEGWGPEGWGPAAWGPEGGGAQNFALFFPLSRLHFRFFSLSFWESSRGVLVGRPPEFHTTARELQTCAFKGTGLQKHHQNSTRRHPEREKKSENGSGRGKKKREILGGPAEGGPAEGGPAEGVPGQKNEKNKEKIKTKISLKNAKCKK